MQIWRAPKQLCKLRSPGVIGGEKKSCAISISSWRQTNRKQITKFFVAHPLVESVIAQGPTKSSVRLRSGVQCDLRVVTTAEYPFALNYFTGSKEHNIEMRSRALQRGWTLNEYRLARFPLIRRRRRKQAPSKIPECAGRSRLVSRGRSRFHSAGAAGKLRRIRSGRNSIPCRN